MQAINLRKISSVTVALALLSTFGLTTIATAAPKATTTQADTAKIKTVIADGDAKIVKRLDTLTKLTAKVYTSEKLSTANKNSLLTEVTAASNGLKNLKTKLDANTTLAGAQADSRLIMTDYRVYMLVAPKINLVKVADNQLTKEGQLSNFASALQTAVASSSQSATLSPKVTDMQTKIKASQATSQDIANKLLALKPSDYNANHAVMKNYLAQLKTVQANNMAIFNQGVAIMKALETN